MIAEVPEHPRKALALIIGNGNYTNGIGILKNAVHDAKAVAEKLLNLGFVVEKEIDCEDETFDRAISAFGEKLKSYEAGLFYFAGHGLQIDNINYLIQVNTDITDPIAIKHRAIRLDEVMERMQNSGIKIKILILDACRDNPFQRGLNKGLAPIFAPKGSIIAFSTSPGETASDVGGGSHSIYTAAFLQHIDDPRIPIEEFFKRVRTTVYTLSEGRQTSWEHTSLIGDFYFNYGYFTNSLKIPYHKSYVADKSFISDGSVVDSIIKDLKSYDWYKQNDAIIKVNSLKPSDIDISKQFLLGRNILQSAVGEAFRAIDIIKDLDSWLEEWMTKDSNHVLNGILFEIYFNHDGNFRRNGFKSDLISSIFVLENNKKYAKSFSFINELLQPFKDFLYYIPQPNPVTLPVEIIIKQGEEDIMGTKVKRKFIESINIKGKDYYNKVSPEEEFFHTIDLSTLKYALSKEICIHPSRLHIMTNLEKEEEKRIEIRVPKYSHLLK